MSKRSSPSEDATEPPKPPEIERRLKFYPTQAIGVPIIALVPLLGLLGFADEARQSATELGGGVELRVDSYARTRGRTSTPMELRATNRSGQSLPALIIELERGAVDAFTEVEFAPEPTSIDQSGIQFRFDDVPDGRARSVLVWFEGDDAGWKSGTASASQGNGELVRVTFKTLVLP